MEANWFILVHLFSQNSNFSYMKVQKVIISSKKFPKQMLLSEVNNEHKGRSAGQLRNILYFCEIGGYFGLKRGCDHSEHYFTDCSALNLGCEIIF